MSYLLLLLLLLRADAYLVNATDRFTTFERCKKLNSVCSNYHHFSLQSLVMSLKK